MTSSEIDIIDANVLIIGGGFAGMWAAIRAAELVDKVVVLEKGYASRSGASTMSGGVTTCPLDEDDLATWVNEFVERGSYMCNPDWTWQVLEGQRERIKQFTEWNVPIVRDDDGNIRRFKSRGMVDVRCAKFTPKAAMEEFRRQAVARGVHIMDRMFATELITSDAKLPTEGEVVGAVGFDVRSGRGMAVRAKQTILATGAMTMKGMNAIDNVVCDGPAMAYRAGTRLVDLEFGFGGTFVMLMRDYNLGSYNVAVAHGARLINRHGERFMEKYDPARMERSEISHVVAAFVKEMIDGRGPVYVDMRYCDESYWQDLAALSPSKGASILLSDKIPDPRTTPLAIEPFWMLWNGGRSGAFVDINCRTNVPGLLAAGPSAKNYATGSHASAGIPTAYAMNSGYVAGENAAIASREMNVPEFPEGIADELFRKAMEPMSGTASGRTPDWLHTELTKIGGTVIDSLINNEHKLARMAARARDLSSEATETRVANPHELVKLHEARNLSQIAEVTYLSCLDRTESRDQFYREDFPDRDDRAWFCWHGATVTESGPRFDREPIPTDVFSPAPKLGSSPRPSAIGAIINGTFDHATYV
jgi:succinate dehydrogenase/fumarate reductase flavoprotein subunit